MNDKFELGPRVSYPPYHARAGGGLSTFDPCGRRSGRLDTLRSCPGPAISVWVWDF